MRAKNSKFDPLRPPPLLLQTWPFYYIKFISVALAFEANIFQFKKNPFGKSGSVNFFVQNACLSKLHEKKFVLASLSIIITL